MGTKFVIKLAAWSILMLYLLCDLILFDGPLKRQVNRFQGNPEEAIAHDIERGIVARVFGQPILLTQVDYSVDEHLWRTGRTREEASKNELSTLRTIKLNELIDHALLRKKVSLNDSDYPVSEKEINAGMKRFASRFATTEEMVETMQKFGFEGEKELRFRVAARIQQNKYLEAHIAPGIAVSNEEIRAWHEDHKEQLTTPELRKVRHIFLAKLENSKTDALSQLKLIQSNLNIGEDFAKLAVDHSEDERTKSNGGELGWLSRSRLPEDFAESVFKLSKSQLKIVETSIGWHLVEVTEIKPSHLRSVEELKPEIIAAIETSRRKKAVQEYRKRLRLQHPEKVIILNELL